MIFCRNAMIYFDKETQKELAIHGLQDKKESQRIAGKTLAFMSSGEAMYALISTLLRYA